MRIQTRLISSALLCLHLVGCSEIQETHYRTYAAAVGDRAVVRGWIPAFVPSSAYDIYEVHDQDTNAQRLRFRIPPSDARAMVRNMRSTTLREVRAMEQPPRLTLSVDWPRELESASTEPTTMGLFITRDRITGPHCVAVEWQAGVVYAWSCSAGG